MIEGVKIEGLGELDKLLKQFAPRVEANILRGSLNAANKVILERAKQLAPVDNGDLRKSLRVTSKIKRANGWVESSIVAGNKQAFYARFIEYGTATFYAGQGDSSRRAYKITPKVAGSLVIGSIFRESVTHQGIKPQPFMRPAFDEKQAEALQKFAEYMKKRIDREFRKQAKAT